VLVEKGMPLATLYATDAGHLDEPEKLLREAIDFCDTQPEPVPLVSRVFTRAEAEKHLADAVR
jgi:thymidine phosphorylase